jgi:hypothetical protein
MTITTNKKRIRLVLETVDDEKLGLLHNNTSITKDILLCELQRIGAILRDEPYYDYDSGRWIDGE